MLDITGFEKYEAPIRYFEEISAIPRTSGNTAAIADYLTEFARRRGLEYSRDGQDNVIIKKPAANGYKGRPAVILQGHSDIVGEKEPCLAKDMTAEGVDIYRDGDYLRARGTTLGADDGVAVAYALAVLDGDFAHPDLEAVFTSDEETGLIGASTIDCGKIKGRTMINIDSDREGVFTVGCAGGLQADVFMPAIRCKKDSSQSYRLTVSGLIGGHSGTEIDKGRGNAVKILGEALSGLSDIRIQSLAGGAKDNAIPRYAECVISANEGTSAETCQVFEAIRRKYSADEPALDLRIERTECDTLPLTVSATRELISLLVELPSGVIKMSEVLEGQVETSLNLGIAELGEDMLRLSFYLRSARSDALNELYGTMARTAEAHGAYARRLSSYPAWEYEKGSALLVKMTSLYEQMYGKSPVIETIHAGLECGIFAGKIPGLECISIGPDNYCLHTTEEHLSLPSFARVWDFLIEFLKTV